MVVVEAVGEAEHKLQFGSQFEKWHIDIASRTDFKVEVGALQLQNVALAARKIDDRIEARHQVGSHVAIAL